MIAKARAVSHGSAYTTYATLKPNQVKEKGKELPKPIYVCSENMADAISLVTGEPDLDQIWEQFKYAGDNYHQHGKPVTRTLVCAEVSPTKEESENWTMDDWNELAHEFINKMDDLEFRKKGDDEKGKVTAKKTDFKHSKWLAMLHKDSKSGIPHLHIMMSRFTTDGRLNDANLIGIKATTVANQINKEREWRQSAAIRVDHVASVKDIIYDSLRTMDHFSWDALKKDLEDKGYRFELKHDNSGNVISYQVWQGKSKFTPYEIGRGLTAKHIENTWKQLHDEQTAYAEKHHYSCGVDVDAFTSQVKTKGYNQERMSAGKRSRGVAYTFGKSSALSEEQGYVHYESDIDRGNGNETEHFTFDLSPHMDNILWNLASTFAEESTWSIEQIVETTIHVFFDLVLIPGTVGPTYSGGGGGGGEEPPKKRDDDEEELMRLTRIARAVAMAHPKYIVRRGRGR